MRVVISDISRDGVGLQCDWQADVGAEVEIDLPSSDKAVVARMVRSRDGLLALAFRQDAAVLRRVDSALDNIGRRTVATLRHKLPLNFSVLCSSSHDPARRS